VFQFILHIIIIFCISVPPFRFVADFGSLIFYCKQGVITINSVVYSFFKTVQIYEGNIALPLDIFQKQFWIAYSAHA